MCEPTKLAAPMTRTKLPSGIAFSKVMTDERLKIKCFERRFQVRQRKVNKREREFLQFIGIELGHVTS